MPCYNAEHCLERALNSVSAQTYADRHVYAVDDASTDNTLRVLQANADRCSFVSQPHKGAAAARNQAIRMSASPFLAFLDADDEWLPEKLERQIAVLKNDSDIGLVCSACFVDKVDREHDRVFAGVIPRSGKLFATLVRHCFVFTPTVVVRRECLQEAGLFHESLPVSEDFNLWLRIAARWKIAVLPEPLAITHRHFRSLSATVSTEERLRAGIAALQHVQASCPALSDTERSALHRAFAERLYFYGSHLLSSGAHAPSREQLAMALKLQPLHWRALAKLGLSFVPYCVVGLLQALQAKLTGRNERGSVEIWQGVDDLKMLS